MAYVAHVPWPLSRSSRNMGRWPTARRGSCIQDRWPNKSFGFLDRILPAALPGGLDGASKGKEYMPKQMVIRVGAYRWTQQ